MSSTAPQRAQVRVRRRELGQRAFEVVRLDDRHAALFQHGLEVLLGRLLTMEAYEVMERPGHGGQLVGPAPVVLRFFYPLARRPSHTALCPSL